MLLGKGGLESGVLPMGASKRFELSVVMAIKLFWASKRVPTVKVFAPASQNYSKMGIVEDWYP